MAKKPFVPFRAAKAGSKWSAKKVAVKKGKMKLKKKAC